tara:strand:+ start:295 stop:999 length:705 start_codon:yes stop_codon:yes gene_type:complete
MATVTINASKQTYAYSIDTSWAAVRDSTTSYNNVDYTTTQTNNGAAIREGYAAGRGGGTYNVRRSFFFFDTSTVNGTITAIKLKLYGVLNGGNQVRVARSTAFGGDGTSAYTSTDFNNWTSLNPGPSPAIPIPYTGQLGNAWFINTTNTLSLNSTAISKANAETYLNLVVVGNAHDYPDSAPEADAQIQSGIQFASSTTFPQVEITYTPALNNIITYSSVIGVEAANISSINSI